MKETNKQKRRPEQIAHELAENIKYTVTIVGSGLAVLRESHIADQFNGNIPKCVELDAIPLGLWELFSQDLDVKDKEKLFRGLVVICMLYIKDSEGERSDILEEAIRIINETNKE